MGESVVGLVNNGIGQNVAECLLAAVEGVEEDDATEEEATPEEEGKLGDEGAPKEDNAKAPALAVVSPKKPSFYLEHGGLQETVSLGQTLYGTRTDNIRVTNQFSWRVTPS